MSSAQRAFLVLDERGLRLEFPDAESQPVSDLCPIDAFLNERGIAPPRCGFDVGRGWLPVVFAALDRMIAAGWDRELHQVKEKFGGLRIYIGGATQPVRDIIAEAERECWLTCCACGRGKPSSDARCACRAP